MSSSIKPEVYTQQMLPSSPLSSVDGDHDHNEDELGADPELPTSTSVDITETSTNRHAARQKSTTPPGQSLERVSADPTSTSPGPSNRDCEISVSTSAKSKPETTESILSRPFKPFDQLAAIAKLEESEREDGEFEQGLLSSPPTQTQHCSELSQMTSDAYFHASCIRKLDVEFTRRLLDLMLEFKVWAECRPHAERAN